MTADKKNGAELPAVANAQPVAHSDGPSLSSALQAYLQKNGSPGEVSGRPDTEFLGAGQLWHGYDHCTDGESAHRVLRGYFLARLRAEHPGEFAAGLRERGLARSSAYELMSYYQRFNSTGRLEVVESAARLEYHKVLALKHLDAEQFEELMSGGEVCDLTLDDLSELGCRDIQARLKSWRDEHDLKLQAERERADKLGIELDTAQARIRALESGVEERNARNPLPPWYRHLRNDVHLSTEAMAQHLAELQQIANEWVFGASRTTDDEEQLARMAAGSCFHNLAGVVAEGQALLKRLAAEYGEDIAADDDLLLLRADDDELQHLSRNRAQIIRDIETDKAARRHQRETEEAAKPRGRGRPKGKRDSKPRQRRGA